MKLRSFFSFLLLGGLVLLLLGGGVLVWLKGQAPLALSRGQAIAPEAAMFVPRQAPVMLSLLTEPDRLEALPQLISDRREQQQVQRELQQLQHNLLANLGLDYQKDLRSWVGDEITLAVTTLDLDRRRDNGRQPGYLAVLKIRDPQGGRDFLEQFWQQRVELGQAPELEQYQGVKLRSTAASGSVSGATARSRPLATATVGRFVLVANDPKVLRTAINNLQVPDLGLPSADDYQQALANLEQERVGLVFINLPELAHRPLKPSALPPYDSLAIALGITRQGLLAELALVPPVGKTLSPQTAAGGGPVGALRYIPAGSGLVAAGVNLKALWMDFQQDWMAYDLLARLVNPALAKLQTQWGLDLPEDIFAQIEGEYSLAMLPQAAGGADWLFVTANQPSAQVQQVIDHLDAIAQAQGLGTSPLTVANQKLTTWARLVPQVGVQPTTSQGEMVLGAQVVGGHGLVDDYQILATSLEALQQSLPAPQQDLTEVEAFKQAIAALASPNQGYLYLDWSVSRPILEQQFPWLQTLEAIGYPLLRHLQSLTLTSYGVQDGVRRSQLFIKLT